MHPFDSTEKKETKPALINFSGHPLSQVATEDLMERFSTIETVPIPSFDFSCDVDLQLRELIGTVKTKLDGSLPVSVILPGHSTLAVLLVIFLHGLLGHFPPMCLMLPTSDGVYRPSSIFYVDAHGLRSQAREVRQDMIRSLLD